MTVVAPRVTAMHWDGLRLVVDVVLDVVVDLPPDDEATRSPSLQFRLSERSTGQVRELARVEWRRSPDDETRWRAAVVVDSATAADGDPLGPGAWDVRTSLEGGDEPLDSPDVEPAILVRDGQVLIAYCNQADHLSVDVGGSIRSVAGSSLVDVPDVELSGRPYDEGMTIRMRLPRLTASGATRVPSDLWLSKQLSFPGELVIDESGAVWFEATRLWVPPGRYRIGGRFGDRGGWTRLDIEVEKLGGYQVIHR